MTFIQVWNYLRVSKWFKDLKTVLPKFYQHVNFATRGKNTLDFVYTTVKNAYKAVPRPHLGYSDHISVMLIPAYRPLLKLAKPVQKLITIWPENATSTLQDCFQCTDWNMFKEAATYNNHTDLQEYTETVTAYIKKCMDDVTVTKTVTTCANQKPWMTAEVRGLLKTRDEAFRSGDKAALKTARANLSCGIKNAKRSHAQKNQQSLHGQQRHTEPVASHSDHHWLQAPATGLWWWSIPPRYTQPLLFTVWNAEWHTCTKTAHTSQWPGALSICSRRKEDPIQD